ncbi:MAG TPA: hypothetical protein VGL17_07450 [Gemmatimonadaceae bacterium]
MPETRRIVIRIKKNKDGRTSLSCSRADGTVTWQRQEGKQAAFFPRHDLTHCAVESVLGQRQGFYGLVAAGWDFSDFGTPWPRGKLPADANVSEMIVGFFDLERQSGETDSATEINRKIAEYCAQHGLPSRRVLTEDDLTRIRERREELFAKWDAVLPGDALEIPFEMER